jgi:hypothetical protein
MKRRFLAAFGSLILIVLSSSTSAAEPFRGNTRTRVFHQASCRYYACSNCTAKFATTTEAVENGYRPCGVCEPGGSHRETRFAGEAAYVGNTKSHKFHRKSCRYSGCPNCTAKFSSRDEAVAAGYAPGGCCSP